MDDLWIACKEKVLVEGDVVRFHKTVFEEVRGSWKKIGLLEVTGQVLEADGEWLALTRVDSVVLEDLTGGKKVHASKKKSMRLKRETFDKGRPRRKPWKVGEDVRKEMVRERTAQIAADAYGIQAESPGKR